jgi:hypothetical protein
VRFQRIEGGTPTRAQHVGVPAVLDAEVVERDSGLALAFDREQDFDLTACGQAVRIPVQPQVLAGADARERGSVAVAVAQEAALLERDRKRAPRPEVRECRIPRLPLLSAT